MEMIITELEVIPSESVRRLCPYSRLAYVICVLVICINFGIVARVLQLKFIIIIKCLYKSLIVGIIEEKDAEF